MPLKMGIGLYAMNIKGANKVLYQSVASVVRRFEFDEKFRTVYFSLSLLRRVLSRQLEYYCRRFIWRALITDEKLLVNLENSQFK